MYPMRKTYLAMIFCLIFITSSAQPGRNEISVGISGGISALHYSVSEGKFKPQGGASLNLGYLLKITDLWGIGTGTELSLYRSKVNIDRYSDNYTVLSNSIPDGSSEQNTFDFRFTYTNFREEQKALYLNIPIFFQLQSDNHSGIYAKAGIKIGIPITATRNNRYSALKTSAYFPYEDIEYTDLTNHGFGNYPAARNKSDLKLKYSLSPFAEIGWKWHLGAHQNIYAGIYGEYGVRKIYDTANEKPFLQYSEDGTITGNPIWESSRQNGKSPKALLSSPVHLMSIGVTVRWAISL